MCRRRGCRWCGAHLVRNEHMQIYDISVVFFADDNQMTNDKFTLAIRTQPHSHTERKRKKKKRYAQITAHRQTSLLLHIG